MVYKIYVEGIIDFTDQVMEDVPTGGSTSLSTFEQHILKWNKTIYVQGMNTTVLLEYLSTSVRSNTAFQHSCEPFTLLVFLIHK